jgi:heparin binding hemagglutinin HbhA
MSITSEIRSYADNALEQGKQVLDQAQAQLNDVTGQANEFVGKLRGTAKDNVTKLQSTATDTVTDLRSQAEKAINVEAIKAAVEPYLAQAKGYSTSVSDRAEGLYSSVKSDKRVAAVVARAEELVDTVTERVQSLTGRSKPAKHATKPASVKAAPVKAATKAPARKAPAKKAPARKAPARKTAAR